MQDVMSTEVETIGPSEQSMAARQRMMEQNIHHLVVREGREIVGVVSSRDLKGVSASTAIAEVMSHNPVTIDAHATVRQAANLLRGRAVGCLPVMEGGKLVGMVTISDLLALVGKGVTKPVEVSKRWTLRHRGPRKGLPAHRAKR
jgi:acetoin utilization protein AcuB